MDDEYKLQRELFVSGHSGDTKLSVYIHLLMLPIVHFAVRSFCLVLTQGSSLVFSRLFSLFLECAVLPLLVLVSMTIGSRYCTALVIFYITFGILCISMLSLLKHQAQHSLSTRINSVTNFRGSVMLCTVIAILAVDFSVFPRSLAKTETFGLSLMDLGVGCVIVASGVVSRQSRKWMALSADPSSRGKWSKAFGDYLSSISSIIPLIIMGGVRLVVHSQINYNTHLSEYGIHWNFFHTLTFLTVITSTIELVIMIFFLSMGGTKRYWRSLRGPTPATDYEESHSSPIQLEASLDPKLLDGSDTLLSERSIRDSNPRQQLRKRKATQDPENSEQENRLPDTVDTNTNPPPANAFNEDIVDSNNANGPIMEPLQNDRTSLSTRDPETRIPYKKNRNWLLIIGGLYLLAGLSIICVYQFLLNRLMTLDVVQRIYHLNLRSGALENIQSNDVTFAPVASKASFASSGIVSGFEKSDPPLLFDTITLTDPYCQEVYRHSIAHLFDPTIFPISTQQKISELGFGPEATFRAPLVQDWLVCFPRNPKNLLDSNREGVFSILGYVSIHLFSLGLGLLLNWAFSKLPSAENSGLMKPISDEPVPGIEHATQREEMRSLMFAVVPSTTGKSSISSPWWSNVWNKIDPLLLVSLFLVNFFVISYFVTNDACLQFFQPHLPS